MSKDVFSGTGPFPPIYKVPRPTMTATPTPPPPSASNGKTIWFVLGCGGLLFLLCCGGFGSLAIMGARAIMKEKPGLDAELTSFFNDMAKKDYDAAYGHYPLSVQQQYSRDRFDQATQAVLGATFENYQSYQTTGFRIVYGRPPDVSGPMGTYAHVQGLLKMKDGSQRGFNATLIKEGERWRLYGMNVSF